MARLIDENRIDRIREAAIELIVNEGYGGASIAMIAKKAEVADGYLYRFYKSKQAFVNALLFSKISILIDKMEELLTANKSTHEIMTIMINQLFTIANKRPQDIKFIYVLMHDYSFQIEIEQRAQIKDLCKQLIKLGKKTNEIGTLVNEEEVYTMAITYPIVFMNLRMKNFFSNKNWTSKDKKRVIDFCINALK